MRTSSPSATRRAGRWPISPDGTPVGVTTVAVVVPARDEVALVAACLRSVRRALEQLPPRYEHQVVVVDDGSRDGTATVARAALAGSPSLVVRTPRRGVGPARRLGVERVAETVEDPSRCWLLSTDADCVVEPDWATRHVHHANRGAAAVAGTVRLVTDVDGRRSSSWADEYMADLGVDGTHPHVHGANLGVRLDSYLDAGGFPPVHHSEDHGLWRRLRTAGVEPVSDSTIVVVTSARRIGRAPHGVAADLAALESPTQPAEGVV